MKSDNIFFIRVKMHIDRPFFVFSGDCLKHLGNPGHFPVQISRCAQIDLKSAGQKNDIILSEAGYR